MTSTIDLNADLGEDESPEAEARDIAIMDIVSSCNIACGGHAGSPESMRTMLTAQEPGRSPPAPTPPTRIAAVSDAGRSIYHWKNWKHV